MVGPSSSSTRQNDGILASAYSAGLVILSWVREPGDTISTARRTTAASRIPETLTSTASRSATRTSGTSTLPPGTRTPRASTTTRSSGAIASRRPARRRLTSWWRPPAGGFTSNALSSSSYRWPSSGRPTRSSSVQGPTWIPTGMATPPACHDQPLKPLGRVAHNWPRSRLPNRPGSTLRAHRLGYSREPLRGGNPPLISTDVAARSGFRTGDFDSPGLTAVQYRGCCWQRPLNGHSEIAGFHSGGFDRKRRPVSCKSAGQHTVLTQSVMSPLLSPLSYGPGWDVERTGRRGRWAVRPVWAICRTAP